MCFFFVLFFVLFWYTSLCCYGNVGVQILNIIIGWHIGTMTMFMDSS